MKTQTPVLVSVGVGALIGVFLISPAFTNPWGGWFGTPWFWVLDWPAWQLCHLWWVSGLLLPPGPGEMGGLITMLAVTTLVQWLALGLGVGFLWRWRLVRKRRTA